MVKLHAETYIVKRRNKKFLITKEDLKAKNLALVIEFKTASPDRRGEILSEYYDFNKPFISYFPQFHGTYRDEIINTFISIMPKAFEDFQPARGVDVNSYLSMFYKKHAVREFLYLHPTVQYNRFTKDEHGRPMVEKAQVSSLDIGGHGDAGLGGSDYDSDFAMERKQTDVADYYLRMNSQNLDDTHEGMASYVHHFEGQEAEIVQDFESGLRWYEVQVKSGLTIDKFISVMTAIRMKLQRIMQKDGKDVRFITKTERSERRRTAKPKRPARRILGPGGRDKVPGVRPDEDWSQVDGDRQEPVEYGDTAPGVLESLWSQTEESEGY